MKKLSAFLSVARKPRTRPHGAILFLAVGSIAVLSILALGATSSVMQELRLTKFVTDANVLPLLPHDAITVMKTFFANGTTPQNVTLYDLRDRQFSIQDKTVTVHGMDEQGKINVDLAPKDVLLRLPPLSGATALVDAIVAANIVVKEDLLLFEGMTPQLYDQLKDYVTACGLGLVNINTASSEVLAALGMDADLINKIQIYRAGADGIEGTQDDGVFLALDEIIPVLEKNYGLVAVQQQTLQNLMTIGQLAVTSDYVRFEVTVKKGVKTLGFFNIVVSLGEQRIVSWQEQGSEPVSAKTDKKQE